MDDCFRHTHHVSWLCSWEHWLQWWSCLLESDDVMWWLIWTRVSGGLTGSTDGKIHCWNTETGAKVVVLNGEHTGPVQSVQFNPKYMMLASACTNMVCCDFLAQFITALLVSVFATAAAAKLQTCQQDFFITIKTIDSKTLHLKTKTFCRSSESAAIWCITSYDTNAVISQIYTQSPVLITFCPSTMNKHSNHHHVIGIIMSTLYAVICRLAISPLSSLSLQTSVSSVTFCKHHVTQQLVRYSGSVRPDEQNSVAE